MSYARTSHRTNWQGASPLYPRIMNAYYRPPNLTMSQGGSGAPSNNILNAIPFPVERTMTIDRIAASIQTADAGKEFRLGIYRDLNGYPSTLVIDAGAISTTATGVIAAAIADTKLYGGEIYWIACLANTNVAKVHTELAMYASQGWYGSAGPKDNVVCKVAVAQAYGALPDPFTAGGTYDANALCLAVRVKSVP